MLDSDFAFHCEDLSPEWELLHVVKFGLEEALSEPYSLTILLHTRSADADIDPYDLIGKLATLRIATHSEPAVRSIHGLIVSAEDRGQTSSGSLYEVCLRPPLVRAAHRIQSRVFLEKTTKEIIEAVLTGDPRVNAGDPGAPDADDLRSPFVAAEQLFAWRILDPSRLEDPAARPYVVQYEESDLDFISRLLEEEGISYHFEHGESQVVFVMTDHDDGRRRLDPFDALGPSILGRQLDGVRLGGRLGPTKVTLVDYNWQKPKLEMSAQASAGDDLFVRAYPGRFLDTPDQGKPLARAALERLQIESRSAVAAGACRLLGAGSIFELEHPITRYEGEYLVVRARTSGLAIGELGPGGGDPAELPNGGPFYVELELARRGVGAKVDDAHFRPARHTNKPRIYGTQTAVVTDDPGARGAEIHVGGPPGNENGCVRLKFHWDTDAERHDKEPTSMWVRVSQLFAGAGGGAVAHPRVGTEVIVSYEDGDPDRPIVVGRVFNGIQPASASGKGAATVTMFKSLSSPGGKVNNEISFDDTAGQENFNTNAGKNYSSTVGNDKTETIINNSTSTVNVDRTEQTGANRKTNVDGDNTETVAGDETISVSGRQNLTISSGQDQTVTADRNLTVSGPHTVSVGPESYTVNGAQTATVTAARTDNVGAAYTLNTGPMTVNSSDNILNAPTRTANVPTIKEVSADWSVSASSSASIDTAELKAISSGDATVQGATVTVSASGDVTISGGSVKIKGGEISLEGGTIKIAGSTVDLTGALVKVN